MRIQLDYRPPYAWQSLLSYFAARSVKGVETVDGTYARSIRVGKAIGYLRVGNDATRHRMQIEFVLDDSADMTRAVAQVRDLLDLDAAPQSVADHLSQDARLRDAVAARPGLRVPGAWSVFEVLVRAIVGQQISVAAARTVLGRLVDAYGRQLPAFDAGGPAPTRLFPEPEALADERLEPLGLNGARASTINAVARLFTDEPQFIHRGMPVDTARTKLLQIRGIGPWTAEYVALRALRHPDAFPSGDLGAMKAAGMSTPKELAALAQRWQPWRGYALFYLWTTLEPKR